METGDERWNICANLVDKLVSAATSALNGKYEPTQVLELLSERLRALNPALYTDVIAYCMLRISESEMLDVIP